MPSNASSDPPASQGLPGARPEQQARETTRSRGDSSASKDGQLQNGRVVSGSYRAGAGSEGTLHDTPIKGALSRRAATAALLASDPRYRRFSQSIERCLATFDTVTEWADFIAFLARLLKTLQAASPPFPDIPFKLQIAKRLAQGLNPALPNGVHQKSLEVYREIFRSIGMAGLRRNLHVWSPGLLPFFQFAATSLKPFLLDLYEIFYLPLGDGLRGIARSLAIALLPGIEEETGDHHDRVLRLLERVAESVGEAFFAQCVCLVLISHVAARTAAVNYLARELRPRVLQAVQSGATHEAALAQALDGVLSLLVRSFAVGLDDDNVLVRRGILDMIVAILPVGEFGKMSLISEADKRSLMLSASSIVLRRDLSLNKRLYLWLLGPAEETDKQIDHLKASGLQLLVDSLAADMSEILHPGPAAREPNLPFKVYIALLDKWEIGYAVSEALALRALEILREGMGAAAGKSLSQGEVEQENLRLTAQALYEASEPSIIWPQLYARVEAEMTAGELSTSQPGTALVIWVLNSFRIQDEETLVVHVPAMLAMMIEHIPRLGRRQESEPRRQCLEESLALARKLAEIIPPDTFAQLTSPIALSPGLDRLYRPNHDGQADERSSQDIQLRILQTTTSSLLDENSPFIALLPLTAICAKIARMKGTDGLEWDSRSLIARIAAQASSSTNIATTKGLVDSLLVLARCDHISPKPNITSDTILRPLLCSAFDLLDKASIYDQPLVVQVIWQIHDLQPSHLLSTIVTSKVAYGAVPDRLSAMHAFGTLWRLTDDGHMPGRVLFDCATLALVYLKSPDLRLRRAAETWMRCNLRPYFRILDPVMLEVARAVPLSVEMAEEQATKSIVQAIYVSRVDFQLAQTQLELLATLLDTGGLTLRRAMRSTSIASEEVVSAFAECGIDIGEKDSYLDVLFRYCLRIISTAPAAEEAPFVYEESALLKAEAVRVIQNFVAGKDLSAMQLRLTEKVLVDQLYTCIHGGILDLQHQLLQLLHLTLLTLAVSSGGQSASGLPNTPASLTVSRSSEDPSIASSRLSISEVNNPLLLTVLQDSIRVRTNRALMQHWVDFLLLTIPHLERQLQPLSFPLCDTICTEIAAICACWRAGTETIPTSNSEADVVMLLSALETVVTTAMSATMQTGTRYPSQNTSEVAGLFGYVSTVFTPDHQSTTQQLPRQAGLDCLSIAMRTLLDLRDVTGQAVQDSSALFTRCQDRCQRVVENLYRAHSHEVIDSIVECVIHAGDGAVNKSVFRLLDILVANTQKLVKALCDLIALGLGENVKTGKPLHHEENLIIFTEAYFAQLEGPIAVQSWPSCLALGRALSAQMGSIPPSMATLTVKFFTRYGRLISSTSALADKRMRKDWQDMYSKLLEGVLTAASRSQASRPATPVSVAVKTDKTVLARQVSKDSLRQIRQNDNSDAGSELPEILANTVLPHLRELLVDTDRIQSVCAAIATNVLQKAFKGRTRQSDVDSLSLAMLLAMSHLPTVQKHWRLFVAEAFADGSIFHAPAANRPYWKQLVSAMFDQEGERMSDLLGRVAAPPSANIFANRDLEMQQRSLNLRRLSLVIFSGSLNHYIVQLPNIQEKLVDLLRTPNMSASVQSEVYLCLRVLLCRFSAQHLGNLWPIILSELVYTFEQTMDDFAEQGVAALPLVLSACKLLDLMLVLQTEEFQIHQWLFITDTPDAQRPPPGWTTDAMMDRLAMVVASYFGGDSSEPIVLHPVSHEAFGRPVLTQLRSISTLLELEPFFSQASITAYAGMVNHDDVDWEFVEAAMEREIFDRTA